MNAELVTKVLETGLTPESYLEIMERRTELDPADFEGVEAERVSFAQINLQRSGRLLRSWKPSDKTATLLGRLTTSQLWLVLTEPWCGDSAQCLPILQILAETNPAITVRYLLRDDNLDIMDRYLTNGKRGIPLLVALDDSGDELYRWGPRPAVVQRVFDAGTDEGLDKQAKLERIHLFYGRDRGHALEEEFHDLVAAFLDGTP